MGSETNLKENECGTLFHATNECGTLSHATNECETLSHTTKINPRRSKSEI